MIVLWGFQLGVGSSNYRFTCGQRQLCVLHVLRRFDDWAVSFLFLSLLFFFFFFFFFFLILNFM